MHIRCNNAEADAEADASCRDARDVNHDGTNVRSDAMGGQKKIGLGLVF